jgi:acyl-CoA hydrolase
MARTVSDSRSTLVRWRGLVDANSAGFVHGGTVMKLCVRRANRLAEPEQILAQTTVE